MKGVCNVHNKPTAEESGHDWSFYIHDWELELKDLIYWNLLLNMLMSLLELILQFLACGLLL